MLGEGNKSLKSLSDIFCGENVFLKLTSFPYVLKQVFAYLGREETINSCFTLEYNSSTTFSLSSVRTFVRMIWF